MSDIRRFINTDPDQDDYRGIRHPDRDQQRWGLIAHCVSQVGAQLASGHWSKDDRGIGEEERVGRVQITPPSTLTEVEQEIVRSWFHLSGVMWDPWSDCGITNGRHRVWNCGPHFEQMGSRMPVLSDVLGYATVEQTAEFGDDWPSMFAVKVTQLEGLDWWDREDPVNVRYLKALTAASRGRHPRQV